MAQFDLDSADGIQDVNIVSSVSSYDEKQTFIVDARNIQIGNGKSMLSIVNDSISSVVLKLRELYIINVQNTAVTGVISEFQLKRIANHSAGTLLNPVPYDTNDSVSANVTARTGSTVTSESADILKRYLYSSDEWGVGAADVESFDHSVQSFNNILKQYKYCKPITLRQNQGITIKQITNSTVGTFDIVLVFTQE